MHVSTPQVDVMIDRETYHIESLWDSPIVCELPRASTRCRCPETGKRSSRRNPHLKAAEEVVLTAWERPEMATAKPTSP